MQLIRKNKINNRFKLLINRLKPLLRWEVPRISWKMSNNEKHCQRNANVQAGGERRWATVGGGGWPLVGGGGWRAVARGRRSSATVLRQFPDWTANIMVCLRIIHITLLGSMGGFYACFDISFDLFGMFRLTTSLNRLINGLNLLIVSFVN